MLWAKKGSIELSCSRAGGVAREGAFVFVREDAFVFVRGPEALEHAAVGSGMSYTAHDAWMTWERRCVHAWSGLLLRKKAWPRLRWPVFIFPRGDPTLRCCSNLTAGSPEHMLTFSPPRHTAVSQQERQRQDAGGLAAVQALASGPICKVLYHSLDMMGARFATLFANSRR